MNIDNNGLLACICYQDIRYILIVSICSSPFWEWRME